MVLSLRPWLRLAPPPSGGQLLRRRNAFLFPVALLPVLQTTETLPRATPAEAPPGSSGSRRGLKCAFRNSRFTSRTLRLSSGGCPLTEKVNGAQWLWHAGLQGCVSGIAPEVPAETSPGPGPGCRAGWRTLVDTSLWIKPKEAVTRSSSGAGCVGAQR